MASNDPDVATAALVVAHPDDEILWFSSIVSRVARVHIAFLDNPASPAVTDGRRTVRDCYPLAHTEFFGLPESQCFNAADWTTPNCTAFGIDTSRKPGVRQRYERNFNELLQRLEERLRGVHTVFTHNPWGEYGHEEHVQVHRAVSALQERLGYRIWVSSYASNRSAALLGASFDAAHFEAVTFATDPALAHQLARIYADHNCWTWGQNYQWPEREAMLRMLPVTEPRGITHAVPISMLSVPFRRPPPPSLLRQLKNRLYGRLQRWRRRQPA